MKKKIALFLAVVMAFSTMTSVLATLPTQDVGDEVILAHIPGLTTQAGLAEGAVDTAAAFYIVIDPLGLLDLDDDDEIPDDPITNVVAFSGGGNAPVYFAENIGVADLLFTVELDVVVDHGVTAVLDPDDVVNDYDLNVFFWMELNASDAFISDANAHNAHSHVVPFGYDSDGIVAVYHLPAVANTLRITGIDATNTPAAITAEATPDDDPVVGNGTSFSLGGIFNQYAIWGDVADGAVIINATWTLAALGADDVIGTNPYVPGVIGLLNHGVGNVINSSAIAPLTLVDADEIDAEVGGVIGYGFGAANAAIGFTRTDAHNARINFAATAVGSGNIDLPFVVPDGAAVRIRMPSLGYQDADASRIAFVRADNLIRLFAARADVYRVRAAGWEFPMVIQVTPVGGDRVNYNLTFAVD